MTPSAPHRLILLRHAKSSWKSVAQTDHERPLNDRGRRDAPRVGARLVELGWRPDLILSSDSQRTRETHSLLGPLVEDVPVQFTAELYHGGADALRTALSQLPDDIGAALAIGHNPGWEIAAHWFTGSDLEMTTCNAVLMSTSADSWRTAIAEPAQWTLEAVVRPKQL